MDFVFLESHRLQKKTCKGSQNICTICVSNNLKNTIIDYKIKKTNSFKAPIYNVCTFPRCRSVVNPLTKLYRGFVGLFAAGLWPVKSPSRKLGVTFHSVRSWHFGMLFLMALEKPLILAFYFGRKIPINRTWMSISCLPDFSHIISSDTGVCATDGAKVILFSTVLCAVKLYMTDDSYQPNLSKRTMTGRLQWKTLKT